MKLFVILSVVALGSLGGIDARAFGRNRRQVSADYFNQYLQQQYGDTYTQSQLEPIYDQVSNQYDQVNNQYDQVGAYGQNQEYDDSSSRSFDALQAVDDVLEAIKECVTEKLEELDETLLLNALLEALAENGGDDLSFRAALSDNLYDNAQSQYSPSSSAGYAGRSGLPIIGDLLGGLDMKGRAGGSLFGVGSFKDISSNVLGGQTKKTLNKNTNNFGTFGAVTNTNTKTTSITRNANSKQDSIKAIIQAILASKGKFDSVGGPRADNGKGLPTSLFNKLQVLDNNKMKDSNIQVLTIGTQDSLNNNKFNFKDFNFKPRSIDIPYSADAQYAQPQQYQQQTTVYDNVTPDQQYPVVY